MSGTLTRIKNDPNNLENPDDPIQLRRWSPESPMPSASPMSPMSAVSP